MFRSSLCLILIIAFVSCKHQSGNALRFNLSKGKIYSFQRSYHLEQPDKKASSDVQSAYTLEVTDESGGVKTLRVTTLSQSATLEKDTSRSAGDTTPRKRSIMPAPMEAAMTSICHALEGKSFYIRVNQSGKVVDITGLKELLLPALDSVALPDQMRKSVKALFQSVGEKLYVNSFLQGFDIYPNKPVKKGDTWVKEMQQNGIIPAMVNTNFTVTEVSGDELKIESRSLLDDNNQRGEVLGTYTVEASSGMIRKSEVRTQFGIPVRIKALETLSGSSR